MLGVTMSIDNDQELGEAVARAGALLQEIQRYAQRDFSKPARVRFPRGFLRTAFEARSRLAFLSNSHLKSNISYTMLLSDVQHWLLVRTDIAGTAKEMLIKLQIFLLGSIIESITKAHLKGKCGGNFGRRTDYLRDTEVISSTLQSELDWLWGIRNRMHLFQLDDSEWLSTDYTIANHNRAVRAFRDLLAALNQSPAQ